MTLVYIGLGVLTIAVGVIGYWLYQTLPGFAESIENLKNGIETIKNGLGL